MKKLGVLDFRVSGSVVDGYTGASDFVTDGLDFTKYSKSWILYLESTHTTGTPPVTIQISHNNSDWLDYVSDSVNVSLPASIFESKFYPKYMRISYTANSSDGNVTFKLNRIDE